MLKISLVNMPFATLRFPSIALTQLKSVAESRLGERVQVRILYFNHDFAHYLGPDYEVMNSLQASNAGLGDWLFHSLAFPDLADNAEAYFRRYFPHRDPGVEAKLRAFLTKRAGLERFLQRLIAKHRLDAEDLVGFTSMFAQNTSSFAMARLVKQRNPAVTTVLGGANCEAPMGLEIVRHVPAVDFVFSGPALVSFPEFLERRLAGDLDGCHEIRGVFSKRNVETAAHRQGLDLLGEELPVEVPVPLDYDSFLADLERNFPHGKVRPSLTFETSRGCWWGERAHCTFCGLNGGTMAYRAMPPAQALQLFESLFARYGDRCTYFESVDNIMPREYLTEVFPFVRPPEGVSIFYEVKADLKEREMEVIGRAGVTQIQPGIESLATSTLKLMHKGVTAFQNVNFLKSCVRFGINPLWNLLIGFPRESEEVYRKYMADLPLLVHLPPPSGAFPVRFDRYSPYFTRAGEYGLDLAPYDFYRYIYPFPEEALANLAYYFEDRNYGADYQAQMVSWKDRLGGAVASWAERWSGSDGRPRARLALQRRGAGAVVHDTRSGEVVEHEVDELGLRILAFLDGNGWRLRDIAAHVGAEEARVAAQIDEFRRLGLLFEEGERLISLVLTPVERAPEASLALSSTAQSLAAAAAG